VPKSTAGTFIASTSGMRVLLVVTFITLFTATAEAQWLGYGIAGPAGTSGFINTNTTFTFHAAGGVEVAAANSVGIGGEFGFFNRLIVGSANGVLRFGNVFVTGGFSRMAIGDGEGAFSAINLGGGANAWMGQHAGVRVEYRDHLRRDNRGNTHYWSLRAGIVFR
jgi:hypothetical protein